MVLDGQATRTRAWRGGGTKAVAVAFAIITMMAGASGEAQAPSRAVRVGLLLPGVAPDAARKAEGFVAFRDALAQQGYREGQNLTLEVRAAERQADLGGLAVELVQLEMHVIVTGGIAATRAARTATQSIPIVGVAVGGDPIALGLAQSIARPGGNFTGFLHGGTDPAKLLQLLKEAFPDITRAGILWNPDNPIAKTYVEHLGAEARARGLSLRAVQAK